MSLIPFGSRDEVSTFAVPSSKVRAVERRAEEQAREVATRNRCLTALSADAVRNVKRFADEVKQHAGDSMYVAVAADTYFVELLEGQRANLQRYREAR